MQSHRPRVSFLQNRSSAVSPETGSIHHKPRQTPCRYFFYALLVILTLALSVVANGQGVVAPSTLSFSPSSANFGSVTTGTSQTLSVTIKNTGRAAVKISGESIHATGFSLSGLAVPRTISGGTSTVFSVKFAPTSTGLFSGYISFTGNFTTGSVQYPVSGTGVKPGAVSATPSSVSFGTVATGTTNSQTVQLKNTGSSSVTISSAAVSGTGFKISGITVPLTLAASQTKSFTVSFGPTASGSVTGSVTIRSDASNPTYTMALSGTGGSATRTISLSASSLNFGNEVVGGSIPLGVAVKNTGNSSLTISQVAITGAGFGISGGFIGATIAAGQTAEMTVVFAPKVTGSVTGKVTITSTATNSPNSVSVTGTGISSTSHSVTLNWTASSSTGVVGYYVYRSTTSGTSYSRLNSSPSSAIKYTDGTVSSGTTYYYVVTAVNSSGTESAKSGQVTAVVP
jgi:Abnormal spindle-like microcephaly-assoc'd, ASPM-SPD-2-Hydin